MSLCICTRGGFCAYAISTKILSASSNIYLTEHLNEYSTIKMMKIDGVIYLQCGQIENEANFMISSQLLTFDPLHNYQIYKYFFISNPTPLCYSNYLTLYLLVSFTDIFCK